MSYRIILLALTFLFASHSSVFAKTIETVVSNGMGTSVQLAAQNAAENALTQVVGSFIDVETQLKKRTEIRDGVVAKTKTISKDIKDYSQGSIKYFEILEVVETSGIFRVTARVDVRIDDFKAYIKELAAGEQKVGAGLFGVMKAEKDDEINQASLLVNKIFLPVVRGEVHDVSVGNIMPANRFFEDICSTSNFRAKRGDCNGVKQQIRDLSMTVAVPFSISLKKEFVDNALNVLENIGDTKQVFVGTDGLITGEKGINFLDTSNSQGRAYQITDLPNKILNYLCNNVTGRMCKTKIQENFRLDVKNKYRDIFTKDPDIYEIWRAGSQNSVDLETMTYCSVHNDFWFSVFDADGNPLMREVFETCVNEKYEDPNRQPWLSLMYNENYYPVLSLYAAKSYQQSDPILISKRAYVLLITLDENLLGKAASMKFEYMQ